MKVALFKRLEHGDIWTAVFDLPEYGEADTWTISGYVRISEWVDVEFPPLASDAVVQAQLAEIDRAENEVRTKFQAALDSFSRMRAELLALPASV